MSEKSGTGEGRGGFLREDLEEGREGESGRGVSCRFFEL